MNYYEPRELIGKDGNPTGLWHYTCRNDGKVWAVGNCSPWESCPDCNGEILPENMGGKSCARCDGTRLVRKADPCKGHATPEGACVHQREYELDRAEYRPETPEVRAKAKDLHKCEVDGCGTFTCGFAAWGNGRVHVVPLCNEHCNKDMLRPFVWIGVSVSSF